MLRDRFGALGRPVVLLGIAVACACSTPAASIDPASTPSPAASRGGVPVIMRSPERLARDRAARGSSSAIPAGHKVFGPKDLLTYSGGPVISNVHVVAVDWTDISTPTDTVNPTIAAALPGFFTTITSSLYLAWLAEYSTLGVSYLSMTTNQTIGLGDFDTTGSGPGGTYVITPTVNTTTSVANPDIINELTYQIGAGLLPAPTMDTTTNTVNTLYVIDFPPAFTITVPEIGDTSCKDFCGYHFTFPYGPKSIYVPYDVLIDVTGAGCASCSFMGKTDTENATFIHAHELAEAITDEAVGISDSGLASSIGTVGWYDSTTMPGGEIADLCESEPGQTVSGYYVTTLWSNANGACIATAPLCTLTTPAPPSCTQCTSSDAPACSGTTPLCDMDTTSSSYGMCVGCVTDMDCSSPKGICDKTTFSCRGCTTADCSGSTPVCATSGFDTGLCVQCVDNTNCSGSTPVCNTTSYACVGCVSNTDCSGTTPICSGSETCVACMSDTDCSPGRCDTSSGACVQCLSNGDCGSLTCNTSTHACQCGSDSQCSNPAPVCGSSKSCVACKTSSDCSGSPSGAVCASGSCVECEKSSDCPSATPVCNPKTNKCEKGSGGHDGGGPPGDGGGKKPDGGAADSGAGSTSGTSGGCSAAPAPLAGSESDLAAIAPAMFLAMAARRRRQTRKREASRAT